MTCSTCGQPPHDCDCETQEAPGGWLPPIELAVARRKREAVREGELERLVIARWEGGPPGDPSVQIITTQEQADELLGKGFLNITGPRFAVVPPIVLPHREEDVFRSICHDLADLHSRGLLTSVAINDLADRARKAGA